MTTLHDLLIDPEYPPTLIPDTQALVDNEISSKGITAAPLKAAYKVVTTFAPGYLHDAISSMLPGMASALEPYWADFNTSGGADFGDYLAKRGPEVAEALLAVTDDMAQQSGRAAVVKAYQMVRGGAGKHIESALPALGAMIQKYA